MVDASNVIGAKPDGWWRDREGATERLLGQLRAFADGGEDVTVVLDHGRPEWAAPDADVHAFVNDLERGVGTMLLGRRMYEVLAVWETMDEPEPEMRDFAEIWRAADKVVYSRTLETVATARTRIEREFDPEAVRTMKAEGDVSIGGPELAGHALRAGLVDELQLLISPILVGGGTAALPDGVRRELELVEERRFGNGVVFLRYR
jgi:dihydrofolate reductase